MTILNQLRNKLNQYLSAEMILDDFEDWFLGHTWNSHLSQDAETVRHVHLVEGLLVDYSAGGINEDFLRQELTRIASPFASSEPRILSVDYCSPADPYVIVKPHDVDFDSEPIRKPPQGASRLGLVEEFQLVYRG